jgi:hypothetical protein
MAVRKNQAVKSANETLEYTADNLTELQLCQNDPVYFIKKYVKIQRPKAGIIPFDMYPYQEDMIRAFKDNRFTIVLSARQTGKSICSAAYLLWYAMFSFDQTILIASNKNKGAMEMIHRIKIAYENLPYWLKPGVEADGWNKHNIGFDNGCRIMSTATSDDSGRGMSISLLFLDEFAFVKPSIQEEFWTSIEPTLTTGGSCIMTSTPNGDTNKFAQLWRGSQVGANEFHPIHVKWDEPPGRDEEFKQKEIGKLGIRKWLQEYETEFLSSDALLIDSLFLINLKAEIKKCKPKFIVNDVVFWEDIKPHVTYLLGVDPSTGSGKDFSVISIFEFPSMVQVGEYRNNTMNSPAMYKTLKNTINFIQSKHGNVYFSIENNGVGEGIIALYEADENPPENADFISEEGKSRRGMTTTSRSKMKACLNLKNMLENGKLKIKSGLLLLELGTYARMAGSYAAQTGSTDDCIASVLIVIRMLEELATYEQAAFDSLYTLDEGEYDPNNPYGYEDYDENDMGMPMVF